MTRDDINRWEAEIESWRHRYEALLKHVADVVAIQAPPAMLAEKESYEAGRMMGAKEEREACAKVCDEYARFNGSASECADAIRAMGQG